MDVGIIATHVPPAKGYGGVAVTCGVLTQAWAERGHRMALVASDESISGRLHAEEVQLGDTVAVRLYRCYGWRRWGFGLGAIPAIWNLCRQAPRVYIHGIATWPSTLAGLFCRLLRKPFIVAVHGGLMPEHVELIKSRKPHKWLFYRWLTFPSLRRALAVHCTSDTEAEGIRAALAGGGSILLVPNGIDSRAFPVADYPAQPGMQICFLGHVQQEKGINAFIRAWLQTRRSDDRLVVAGRSVDGAYFDEFLQLLAEAGGAIEYRGYLSAEEVKALLAQSHFLVLPSGLEQAGGMRENFGNVVAEALACGRPALVAKGLAWDHLPQIGAGWVFERDQAAVCQVLRAAQAIDADGWRQMSQSARHHAEQTLDAVSLGDRVWRALTEPAELDPVAGLAEQRT